MTTFFWFDFAQTWREIDSTISESRLFSVGLPIIVNEPQNEKQDFWREATPLKEKQDTKMRSKTPQEADPSQSRPLIKQDLRKEGF